MQVWEAQSSLTNMHSMHLHRTKQPFAELNERSACPINAVLPRHVSPGHNLHPFGYCQILLEKPRQALVLRLVRHRSRLSCEFACAPNVACASTSYEQGGLDFLAWSITFPYFDSLTAARPDEGYSQLALQVTQFSVSHSRPSS